MLADGLMKGITELMKKKSVGVNAVLSSVKAGLSVIFPLITFPYATRVLGAENLGKVNYAQSIENYFALLAALGITTYAIREGAKLRDNKDKLAKFSSEVFSLNVLTTCIAYMFMFIALAVSAKLRSYGSLIVLQSLSILFTTLGVDWLNTIYEDYLLITVRSLITNIVSLIGLFLFVKSPDDYYIYAMLTVLTHAIIGVSNIYYCRKYTHVRIVISKNLLFHLKSSMIFFANNLAVSIYVNADTTMLGWICGDYYVGIYSVAVKIYNIVKTMLASIYAVAIPRLSYYIGNDEMKEYKKLFSQITTYLTLLLLPCMAGLIALSKEIILIIAGSEYLVATRALQILSIGLVFAVFGGLVTSCINIPLKREITNMKATTISALSNIILNLGCIALFKQNGAAITTLISELLVLTICAVSFKNWKDILDIKYFIKNALHAAIEMCVVLCICGLISHIFVGNPYVLILLKVIFSILGCALILIVLKNDIAYEIVRKIKKKICDN